MSAPRMVLRSMHLPEQTDEALRTVAFRLRVSKADLIRQLIDVGFQRYVPNEHPVELFAKANAGMASEQDLKVLEQGISKLRDELDPTRKTVSGPELPSALSGSSLRERFRLERG